MTSIKFELSEEYKKQLKIRAVTEGVTLTSFILSCLYLQEVPKGENTNNAQMRINDISTILAKNGANMTKEEREKLKAEREQLKKGMREN